MTGMQRLLNCNAARLRSLTSREMYDRGGQLLEGLIIRSKALRANLQDTDFLERYLELCRIVGMSRVQFPCPMQNAHTPYMP